MRASRSIAAGLFAASLVCGSFGVHAIEPAAAAGVAVDSYRLLRWPAAAAKPQFDLVDGHHERRSVADFRGEIAVVFFGFTHCPDICPSELFKLAQVIKRLGALGPQVHVLFITLDPERDTPELVKDYATTFDPQFIGLTGSAAEINLAASSFSVQFAKVAQGKDYTISHSTGTYVLDRQGRVTLVGTPRSTVDDWVHDLTILAATGTM